MKLRIEEGCIKVNEWEIKRESDHALLIYVDLIAKYADCSVGLMQDSADVMVFPDERTLNVDDRDGKPTMIHLPGLGWDEWYVTATVGRYTLIIAAIKKDPAGVP